MTASVTEVQTKKSAQGKGQKKIAILGCGKMGTILLQGFLEHGLITKDEVVATVQHDEHRRALARELSGVTVTTDNKSAVTGTPIILLGVKPQALATTAGRNIAGAGAGNVADFVCCFHHHGIHSAESR